MDREHAISLIQAHRPALATLGVRSLSLFGSTARSTATPHSDVDVLVEFVNPPDMRQFMALKFQLEEWLGAAVDLIDRAAVSERWRPAIEGDAVLVA